MERLLCEPQRSALDRKLQAYLRQAAQRGPHSERTGPFLATFNEEDDNVYLNYAIPDDGAELHEGEITALFALFVACRRRPRLEYMAAAASDLDPAPLAHGLTREARVPSIGRVVGAARRDPAAVGCEGFVGPSAGG